MRRPAPRGLGQTLERLRSQLAPASTLARIQVLWKEAVGTGVSTAATPVAERSGVLTVACESAVWAQELDLMQRDLLERINAALTSEGMGLPINGMRFVVQDPRREADL